MEKKRAGRNSAAFAATLAVCLLAVGFGSWRLLRRDRGAETAPPPQIGAVSIPEDTPAADALLPEPLEEPAEPEPVPDPEPAPEPAPAPAPKPETRPASAPAAIPKTPAPDPDPVPDDAADREHLPVVLPLEGETVAAFSVDRLLYNATLGDWRTHDGVDIAAEPGAMVLAACAGTVASVTDDPLMGLTVVIAHDGGYETTYASLLEVPVLEAGDPVPAGDLVGTVGNTAAAEASQGPHLHFSVKKDGLPVDPEEFLRLEPGTIGDLVEED